MSAACTAWFYSPAKDRVTGLNVINKIVAGLDPPFCHVELQFPNGEACSIVMNGLVTLRKRPFDLDFYTAVGVRADVSAVDAAHALARQHVQAQTSFGVTGKRTFCSKLVLDLLCDSGMLGQDMRSKTSRVLTPSALFRMLQQRQSSAPTQSRQLAISFVQPLCTKTSYQKCTGNLPLGFKNEETQKNKENVSEESVALLST
jgi:hypothetical protein